MTLAELHSCKDMDAAVADPSVAIFYRPRFRAHRICNINLDWPFGELYYTEGTVEWGANVQIDFCPWCGELLPGDLSELWHDVIYDDLGLDDFSSSEHDERLPEEMHSEEWWRRRSIGITNEAVKRTWRRFHTPDANITVRAIDPEPGYRRPRGRSPHMCDIMREGFNDVRNMFAYLPHVREYGIRVLDPAEPVDYQPIRIKPINYCFWCGDKLPASLRSEWEQRLTAQGLTPDDPDVPTNIPMKWCTDQWWREEGL